MMRVVVFLVLAGSLNSVVVPAMCQLNQAAAELSSKSGDSATKFPVQGAGSTLPDAPQPRRPEAIAGTETLVQLPDGEADQESSSQEGASAQPQQTAEKTQHEKAEEQLKQQEKQRVMGVMAAFNTTRDPNAVPLSPGQKFKLFFRSARDPWPFGLTAVVAGIGQAQNSNPEWGQGMEGYAKRYGAGYGDYFIGNLFGNAILTSLLHEDPRYFQKGSGNKMKRFLWAAGSTVWCKRDKGTWGPNYSNVGGNMIGSAIARVYYPEASRTVGDTISDGLTVTVEGIVGAEVIEFWPDLVRMRERKKAAKMAAKDAAAKHAAEDGKTGQDHSQPVPTSPK